MSTISSVGEPVNWQEFYALFRTYSKWNLEWNNGEEWVGVKDDLTIERSFPAPHHCKFNLIFDASHAGDYRLTFAINRAVRDHVKKVDKWQYELTYEGHMITFDWSDCKDIPGLRFSHGVKNGYFWFRIRRDNVPLGAHVEIDPSTVATSTDEEAVNYGFQRKGFHAEGLFWSFYSNGTNAGWEFSADGVDWSGAFTSIGACIHGNAFSIWFDEATGFVHYARYVGNNLFYCRGTPVNDGSINWSAEQTVKTGSSWDRYLYPCISVDTNGYAWIGARYSRPAVGYDSVVLKNANNDGTWALDFHYTLSGTNDSTWRVCPVPLTDGNVYVIYCRNYVAPLGILWDGDWDAGEENDLADFSIELGHMFSAGALGDNVHFVYHRMGTDQIRHNERVWGVGWDVADVLVQTAVTADCGPALSVDPSANELYCFWTDEGTDHVYYKKYSGGAWGGLVDWIDESADDIQQDNLISSFYMDYGGYIGLLYLTLLGSPYNVRFAFLTMPLPPVEKPWTIDTVFKALGVEEDRTIDVGFQLQAIPETFDMDTAFQLLIELQRQINAAFQLTVELTPDLDSAFQLLIELQRQINAAFQLTVEMTPDMDVAIQLQDIPKAFGMDVYFFIYPPPIIVYLTSDEVEAELTSEEVAVRIVV